MDSANQSVAIMGAGITGLSIGYALQKKGIDVTIYEKENRAGGVIQSHRSGGWLVEKGPNTLLVKDQRIWDLLDDLNLYTFICKPGKKAQKRYIVRNRKLCAVPMGFVDFLKSDLLSVSAKLRLLKEPFINAPQVDDVSIADFIARRLGPEPLDYGVNPFVSGIYSGDPKQLSVKHTFSSLFEMEQEHGSIARGFLKKGKNNSSANRALISLKNGLHQLPQALANSLGDALLLATHVHQIKKTANNWTVETKKGGSTTRNHHSVIISSLPAHQLPKVWRDAKTEKSINQLADISYTPMSVLGLGFKRDQIEHPLDGFGMLVPAKEPFSFLGCLFSSSLFKNRAPLDHVLLTCFIGGVRQPKKASKSTEVLIDEIMPQLRELLGVQGAPVFHRHNFWEKAIPQYSVGYDRYLQAMKKIEYENPGFYLAGNYRGGVSVPDCILNGFETAEKVEHYL